MVGISDRVSSLSSSSRGPNSAHSTASLHKSSQSRLAQVPQRRLESDISVDRTGPACSDLIFPMLLSRLRQQMLDIFRVGTVRLHLDALLRRRHPSSYSLLTTLEGAAAHSAPSCSCDKP